jgi:hypothetical protein
MLKNFSSKAISSIMEEEILRSGALSTHKLGRPCEVRKEKLIGFVLFSKIMTDVYEKMELNSELFLDRHYDHSNFQYHYKNLPSSLIYSLTSRIEVKIKQLTNEILLHIADSSALSTSVRVERIRQGTRKKVKLTTKFHTLLGYDPPNGIIVVEGMLASNNKLSDSKGAQKMMAGKDLKGYSFGDSAFETYDLIDKTIEHGLIPIYKPTKKNVRKKLSAKARLRKCWNGNHSRLYKDIRGTGEALYGGATRCGLIHTNSIREDNRQKDALLIGLRQNLFTYLRLKTLIGIIRKSLFFHNLYKPSNSPLFYQIARVQMSVLGLANENSLIYADFSDYN